MTEQQEINDLEILSELFLVELYYEKKCHTLDMELTSLEGYTNNLYKDIIISNQNDESLKKTLHECVEILKLFNHSYALNCDEFKLSERPMLTNTIYNATTFLQKNVTINEKLEKIDITKYRTIIIGDDEDDQERYGCLKTANMNAEFKIYEVANYVGPKNFKIVSTKPIGTYDPESDELRLNEE
jgi:hypothetical protein